MKLKKVIIISFVFLIIGILIIDINIESFKISSDKYTFIKDNNIKNSISKINNVNRNVIGYINIPKIDLSKSLYDINSYYNNVAYNIEINDKSNMPNVIGGNLILEAHSGYSYNSFFKNLYKLNIKDIIEIEYNGYLYTYEIDNIYEIKKNGLAKIKRDYDKSTLTLITCTKDKSTSQTIYISYLKKKECLN